MPTDPAATRTVFDLRLDRLTAHVAELDARLDRLELLNAADRLTAAAATITRKISACATTTTATAKPATGIQRTAGAEDGTTNTPNLNVKHPTPTPKISGRREPAGT